MMGVKERNKRIKEVLGREFGYKNVRVRGGRGTAYGWVHIYITVERPHTGSCEEWERQKAGSDIYVTHIPIYGECEDCHNKRNEVRERVMEILEKTGLMKEIGTYYDDMGEERKEMIIEVELKEREEGRNITVVEHGEDYKVIHEGSWTWVYFAKKPSEEIRQKLKEQGFKFSRRRMAWYKPEKVEVAF